jgi:hypothetical protein
MDRRLKGLLQRQRTAVMVVLSILVAVALLAAGTWVGAAIFAAFMVVLMVRRPRL